MKAYSLPKGLLLAEVPPTTFSTWRSQGWLSWLSPHQRHERIRLSLAEVCSIRAVALHKQHAREIAAAIEALGGPKRVFPSTAQRSRWLILGDSAPLLCADIPTCAQGWHFRFAILIDLRQVRRDVAYRAAEICLREQSDARTRAFE